MLVAETGSVTGRSDADDDDFHGDGILSWPAFDGNQKRSF
jgi:hypothetical protein